MSKDFWGRLFFMASMVVGTTLLTECGLGHPGVAAANDTRYERTSIAQLAEQNRLYRDSLMADESDLASCQRIVSDVRDWNGLSPRLELLQNRLTAWRGRLRAALRRDPGAEELKASYASENDAFAALLGAGYPEILQTQWDLATYQQGVQTRAGGSVAAALLEGCREPLAAWGSRLEQAAVPDEILAWRQKN